MSARILFSVGDASGDLHAAALARSLRARDAELELFGLGGPAMQSAGVDLVASASALAIGGLVEVVHGVRQLRATWRSLLAAARDRQPDLVVLVDSGGFNLPLARALRRVCDAPILYFVAPQVWAWRPGRLRKLARRVDRVALILPFEPPHYDGSGVHVDFVGHPLVDAFASAAPSPRAARARSGLPPEGPVVALLPGSRRNEVEAHLPLQLDAMRLLAARRPGLRCVLARAPSIEMEQLEAALARIDREAIGLSIEDRARQALEVADVVLAKPGTGTTEAMLLGRPMVVVARAHPLTAAIVRSALRVPHLAMPNLVAGERIVPELWQQEARPEAIAAALDPLFEGPERASQCAALARAAAKLGPPGAIERTADVVFEMLAKRGARTARRPAGAGVGDPLHAAARG